MIRGRITVALKGKRLIGRQPIAKYLVNFDMSSSKSSCWVINTELKIQLKGFIFTIGIIPPSEAK